MTARHSESWFVFRNRFTEYCSVGGFLGECQAKRHGRWAGHDFVGHDTDIPGTWPPRRRPLVDLGAIEHNVRVLREHAGPRATMAVVKADGWSRCYARRPNRPGPGAAELGVATVDEALALRADGITAPVLAWLHPPGIDFGPALLADVQVAVSSLRQLDELLHAVRRTGRTARR